MTDKIVKITCDGCGEHYLVEHRADVEVLFCPFCNQTISSMYDSIEEQYAE